MDSGVSMSDIIATKRDADILSQAQLDYFVQGVVSKKIPESQTGALLMAVYLRGMTREETVHLTKAMVNSVERLHWPKEWSAFVADKHSTGGVGDKVSLVLVPALAICGAKVPMISARGIDYTGGTVDKLEAIPGFNAGLTRAEMQKVVTDVGCCIVGQTESIVPADTLLYEIRQRTGLGGSVALTASSIISTKVIENLSALVLDIKCGKAARLQTFDMAQSLAYLMVGTASGLGIESSAFITRMDAPLGKAVGTAVEVAEALKCMQGEGPEDLEELVCKQGGCLLASFGKAASEEEGQNMIRATLNNGTALKKFREMITAQGVNENEAGALCSPGDDPYKVLPRAPRRTEFQAHRSGIVKDIDALKIGTICSSLQSKSDGNSIYHGAGLVLGVRVGEYIEKGKVWVIVHHREDLTIDIVQRLRGALTINEKGTKSLPIESRVIEVIDSKKPSSIFVCQ